MPPHAITFWRDLGNFRMGLSPVLCHRQTLFQKRSKAVSSVNIVLFQLSFVCACAQAFLISICRSVSIGVAKCRTFIPLFFYVIPYNAAVTCENWYILRVFYFYSKLTGRKNTITAYIICLSNLSFTSVSSLVLNGACFSWDYVQQYEGDCLLFCVFFG